MYAGRQFNREQLVFVVGNMLASGFNFIESSLPPDGHTEDEWKALIEVPADESKSCKWFGHVSEICSVIGWNLSVFYAQLTGDGMGVGDAIESIEFEDFLMNFSEEAAKFKMKNRKLPGHLRSKFCYPPKWDKKLKEAAEMFVEMHFFSQGPNGENPHHTCPNIVLER